MDTSRQAPQLTFFADRAVIPVGVDYSPILFPFWGPRLRPNTPFTNVVFERHGFDSSYYSLADRPEKADFVFLPVNYWLAKRKCPDLIEHFIHVAHAHQKPILIDAYGDRMDPIPSPGSVILRLATYRFRLRENDIIMPVYTEDLLESYGGGVLKVREKDAIPSIGFAGWADIPFVKYPRANIKDWGYRAASIFNRRYAVMRKGVFLRREAMRILERASGVETHFLARSSYSGYAGTAEKDFVTLRREFIENMRSTTYMLDVRGDANASARFYEALSLGVVPIVVDTARVFPLEGTINYREFCIWVDYADFGRIGKMVLDFHQTLTNDQYEAMQRKARHAFEHYLRIDRFTPHLIQKLREHAKRY